LATPAPPFPPGLRAGRVTNRKQRLGGGGAEGFQVASRENGESPCAEQDPIKRWGRRGSCIWGSRREWKTNRSGLVLEAGRRGVRAGREISLWTRRPLQYTEHSRKGDEVCCIKALMLSAVLYDEKNREKRKEGESRKRKVFTKVGRIEEDVRFSPQWICIQFQWTKAWVASRPCL